jgi:hypothetical protein
METLEQRIKWIEAHCRIQNPRKGEPIPYRATPIHADFFKKSGALRLEPCIDVCVKPRQVGISTAMLCHILALALSRPGTSILWVSQDEDNAKAMRRKFRIIWKSAASSPGSGFQESDIIVNNPTEFALSNGSHISFLWSGNNSETSMNVGRGDTFHFIVFTELAYWAAPEETWRAIRPAIEHAGASIVYDSTPNGTFGRGSMFYREAMKAKRGSPGYRLHFWPWYLDYRYRKPRSYGNFDSIHLTALECELMRSRGLDLEQIAFRRHQIDDVYGGDIDTFLEIYPESFEEAFKTQGKSIFDRSVTRAAASRIANGVLLLSKSALVSVAGPKMGSEVLASNSLVDCKHGYLRVFSQPNPGGTYYIGVDSSQGIFDGEANETDWLCAAVIDDSASICAILRCKISSILFSWILQLLGQYYNSARVFIEDSSTGPAIFRYLVEPISRAEIDKYGAHQCLQMSYEGGVWLLKNNTATRPLIVNHLLQCINESSTRIPDDETLLEAMSLEADPKTGKIKAAKGQHDDIMFAIGLGLWGRALHLTRELNSNVIRTAHLEGKSQAERYKYASLHAEGVGASQQARGELATRGRAPGLSGGVRHGLKDEPERRGHVVDGPGSRQQGGLWRIQGG